MSNSVFEIQAEASESFERAKKLLSGIEGGIEKASKNAIERASSHLRSNSVAAIRERYAISAANLRANENVKSYFSYAGGEMSARMVFYGKKIPLWRYDGGTKVPTLRTPSKKNMSDVIESVWASGRQLKSESPKVLTNTFVARFKSGKTSGHTGIFEMTGLKGDHNNTLVSEKMGSAFPQMLGNEIVMENLSETTLKKYAERMEHETMRLLGGIGR